MGKNIVKITETELKRIICESVSNILNETIDDWFNDDADTLDIEELQQRLAFFDKYPHMLQYNKYNMLYSKYKTKLWTRAHIMWKIQPIKY